MKIKNNNADVDTMFRQLKADLNAANTTAYGSDGLRMAMGDYFVVWELQGKRNKRLVRYHSDGVFTTCSDKVYSFKYQGVFTGYMAFEIVSGDGPLSGMIQVR